MNWKLNVDNMSDLDKVAVETYTEGHGSIPNSTLAACICGLADALSSAGNVDDETVERLLVLNLYAWAKFKSSGDKERSGDPIL